MRDRRSARRRVASPPERPLIVFDGDCGFCRLWVNRWRAATGGRIDIAPSQALAGRFPELPVEELDRSVLFIDTNGDVSDGAEGVFRALALSPGGRAALRVYERVPGAAALAEFCYGLIARHRVGFSRITRWLWGADLERPTFHLARCLFLRLIGLVYLVAFVSLWVQIDGLVGSNGILPSGPYLEAVHRQLGASGYWLAPTLCWIAPGDGTLHLICGGGVVLSCLLILGVVSSACSLLLWVFYLSLTTVCRTFLGYQWDNLLLEAGFLTVFLSPLKLRCRLPCQSVPSRLPLALMRWLLFRLVFSSGAVKLIAIDRNGHSAWRDLTALNYHYETQPLPTWTSWYAHRLPAWFQGGSTLAVLVLETAAPFFIFAPRRLRLAAFGTLVALQLLFTATGNFAFFNLLSIVLCVPLLDDGVWPVRWRAAPGAGSARDSPSKDAAGGSRDPGFQGRSRRGRWPLWITAPIAAVVLVCSLVELSGTLRVRIPWPSPIATLVEAVSPLRSVNSYGLFATMTTSRPEIAIEGSDDGNRWLPYEFKWKPGDLARAPRFVAPYQPRLDWQMWFAALEDYRSNPWFTQFLARLLSGSPQVLALLEQNPFPRHPPRYIRAILYDYHFTDAATRRRDGTWWRREPLGLYCPVATLPERQREDAGRAP